MRAVFQMLLTDLCIAGMTCTVTIWPGGAIIFAATVYIGHRAARIACRGAATRGAEPLAAPSARPGI
jgi:hypothetical protein